MKLKIKHIISVIIAIFVLTGVPVLPAAADSPATQFAAADACNGSFFFPTWYKGICTSTGGTTEITPPNKMPGENSGKQFGTWLMVIGMNIVAMLLYVVGYVSLIFIIWGGFKYMLNGDNSSGTVAARKTIQNAIIGLVLSIASVSLVSFVTSRITSG